MSRLFFVLAVLGVSGAVSCGRFSSPNSTTLAEQTDQTIGCAKLFEDEFWNSLYGFALAREKFADRGEMVRALRIAFEKGRLRDLNKKDREIVINAVADLYELLSDRALQDLKIDKNSPEKILEALTNLEMGDRESSEKIELQNKIRAKFDEIESVTAQLSVSSCPPPSAEPTPPQTEALTLVDHWKQTRHPVVSGALKALANSYQSCDAGIASPLSDSTADIQGITVTGLHPDGVGNKRLITDLDALIRSHPYLYGYVRPSGSCHEVLKDPMIYDYGGKPYATNATDSELDFFTNAGSGTNALGIDCSGYVYSALATSGLKLKKSGRLKAINVMGVPARMYMSPQANGLTCLDFVAFSRSRGLQPGDILASTGHVLIIGDVGPDPFGISHITTEAGCKTENIDISKFDFTILHSAPVKGAIGISHMDGAHYFAAGGAMATAMVQHAVNACLAKVRNSSIVSRSSSASLIRHLGTAECRDQTIRLSREECLASCRPSSFHMGARN